MSLAALSNILPLPEADLQQILDYVNTLSKQEAAEHFNNLLGESPQSIEFISSFNSARSDPKSQSNTQGSHTLPSSSSEVPKQTRGPKKKKATLGTPAPRPVQNNYAIPGKAYKKQDEEEYISGKPGSSSAFALSQKPEAIQAPTPRAPPSAAGTLISDFARSSKKNTPTSSKENSRTSSPAPNKNLTKTKVNITGGTSMHGASTTLNELDGAIRALEVSTNPSKQDDERRKCNCIATRHPLLAAAPNCLNCGKVICVKEGLGPCTFCGTPLISPSDLQSMIRALRDERGKEKMVIDAQSHRRPEISQKPLPFTPPKVNSTAESKALEHRDRLLNFQANNAKRTTVHDEAADFETPEMGTSMWTTPSERALQLKRQQKVLAAMEWNAKPEYERRKQVVSLNLVGGKLKQKWGYEKVNQHEVEEPEEEVEIEQERLGYHNQNKGPEGNSGGGTFSQNPLLGGLIKPVWTPRTGENDNIKTGEGENVSERKQKSWRRVQDDLDNNEAIILDGGVYGDSSSMTLGEEEHAVG